MLNGLVIDFNFGQEILRAAMMHEVLETKFHFRLENQSKDTLLLTQHYPLASPSSYLRHILEASL
jgi:hypothetical protein